MEPDSVYHYTEHYCYTILYYIVTLLYLLLLNYLPSLSLKSNWTELNWAYKPWHCHWVFALYPESAISGGPSPDQAWWIGSGGSHWGRSTLFCLFGLRQSGTREAERKWTERQRHKKETVHRHNIDINKMPVAVTNVHNLLSDCNKKDSDRVEMWECSVCLCLPMMLDSGLLLSHDFVIQCVPIA